MGSFMYQTVAGLKILKIIAVDRNVENMHIVENGELKISSVAKC